MSIVVEQLTKIYGRQKAVDSISFSVQSGNVLGFLGPNGAGKSTTMKMLSCFLPPTSGKALVNGFDIDSDALEVRRSVGYLPEHNPLYPDLYVKESLNFVADIHQVQNKMQRIKEVIGMTGLAPEQHKKIGQLSKGYRQRVGLAQAILHDPQVLILDEPTSGLDPNQLIDVRNLIKELGRTKTIILSTHIMQEVEAVCDRVIIINRGEIAEDKPLPEMYAAYPGKSLEEIFISLTHMPSATA